MPWSSPPQITSTPSKPFGPAKDVYVEKPVCHTIWEGRQMMAAAKKYNRIVQPGFQNRSDLGLQEAFEWIKAGNIGDITMVRGLCYKSRQSIGKLDTPMTPPATVNYDEWLGPAADEPLYRPQFHYDWHWSWNTGNGDFGNQGPHELDLMRWILDEPDHPLAVKSFGSRFGWHDGGETPNMQITSFDWGGVPALFEVRDLWVDPETNARAHYKGNRVGVIITCEGGEFRGGRGGGIIYYEGNKRGEKFTGNGGFDHMPAFVRSVRSRKESDLACSLETGFLSSSLAHWGNIPIRAGSARPAQEVNEIMSRDEHLLETYERFSKHLDAWNIDRDVERWTVGPNMKIDAASERFTGAGSDLANTYLHRQDRKGYEIPHLAYRSLLGVAVVATSTLLASAENVTPLEIEFPPPFLIGTPVPIKVPHLEDPGTPRPQILVPAGVTNLASGKEVTSSTDFLIIGELEFVTDGDKQSEEGYFVELDPGLQWLQGGRTLCRRGVAFSFAKTGLPRCRRPNFERPRVHLRRDHVIQQRPR